MIVGFITGTFDLLHASHLRLLHQCSQRCDYLIVGLVTDELGAAQKRIPLLSFNHRRVLLENCKWVDAVTRFSGETKSASYDHLKFDILFSSSEYIHSSEHSSFELQHPEIKCIYIPKDIGGPSTTQISKTFKHDLQILALGTTGPLFLLDNQFVIKTLTIVPEHTTKDIYGFFDMSMLPRNWKSVVGSEKFPCYAGINPAREIYLNEKYKYHHFSLFVEATTEHCQNDVVMLKSRFFGQTFTVWSKTATENQIDEVHKKVRHIIEELRQNKTIHFDLHGDNVLVQNDQVKIIDWGWGLDSSFEMSRNESEYFQTLLRWNFDLLHWNCSTGVATDNEKIAYRTFISRIGSDIP